ncbi:2-keto-4-pentenoate hydratase [Alicyclobacillus dauci]|uniref:2-keto-4-pentenoate hydratase n=1 Tax=Alicyclobacillus dauci TaxID=1475485 RepID=A0ABY6Z387_9BACL|nr:2-keto-4-pentenoate hydratase [Alicyclobacillus dauci]WAH37132.1 2-keto-4-pentenoate hydratase [Alicyclobacillus dauci]
MFVDESVVHQISEQLYNAEKDRRVVAALTDRYPGIQLEKAYEIQLENVNRKKAMGDPVVGHKIGLTSKAMQRMLGVQEPDFGHLFASMSYHSGDVVDYPFIQPKVEPELAFVLQDNLEGPNIGIEDVLRATRFVVPAVEVIDSRITDWKIKLADTIADNASSGCFVLGDSVQAIAGTNILTAGAVLKINGEVVETGAGAAVMGNPAVAVAWLANKLSSLGTTLRSGDIILSGAVSAAVPVNPGDYVSLSFGHLGRVEFTLQC